MSFTSQKYKKYFTLDHNGPKNVRMVQTIASIGVEMMPQLINMFGKLFADKRYVLQDLPRTGVIDDVKNAICVFVKDYEHSISWDCTNLLHYALSNNSDTKVAKYLD